MLGSALKYISKNQDFTFEQLFFGRSSKMDIFFVWEHSHTFLKCDNCDKWYTLLMWLCETNVTVFLNLNHCHTFFMCDKCHNLKVWHYVSKMWLLWQFMPVWLMSQFKIVTNVTVHSNWHELNAKFTIFFNMICDITLKMWHDFENVTLFLKCDTIFKMWHDF